MAYQRAEGGYRKALVAVPLTDVVADVAQAALSEDRLPNHTALTLAARVLFTLIFFLSGVTHFTGVAGYVALMHESIPLRQVLVLISGVVELAGAGMILFN